MTCPSRMHIPSCNLNLFGIDWPSSSGLDLRSSFSSWWDNKGRSWSMWVACCLLGQYWSTAHCCENMVALRHCFINLTRSFTAWDTAQARKARYRRQLYDRSFQRLAQDLVRVVNSVQTSTSIISAAVQPKPETMPAPLPWMLDSEKQDSNKQNSWSARVFDNWGRSTVVIWEPNWWLL